jgi:hypothetical protein
MSPKPLSPIRVLQKRKLNILRKSPSRRKKLAQLRYGLFVAKDARKVLEHQKNNTSINQQAVRGILSRAELQVKVTRKSLIAQRKK